MTITTMTSDGQLTVPAEVRRQLGLRAGSRVEVIPEIDGFRVVPVAKRSAADLAGCLKAPRHVSVEEMDRGIAAGAVESAGL